MGREGAEERTLDGKQLECPFCGHDRFFRRKAQLNTKMATFFGVDWLNPTSQAYICEQCGRVELFMED